MGATRFLKVYSQGAVQKAIDLIFFDELNLNEF